jgi:hypothetical protein
MSDSLWQPGSLDKPTAWEEMERKKDSHLGHMNLPTYSSAGDTEHTRWRAIRLPEYQERLCEVLAQKGQD